MSEKMGETEEEGGGGKEEEKREMAKKEADMLLLLRLPFGQCLHCPEYLLQPKVASINSASIYFKIGFAKIDGFLW